MCSEPLRVSTVSSDFESQSKSSTANGWLRSRSRKHCCRHEKWLEWRACTLHGGEGGGVRKPTLLPYFTRRDPQPQWRRHGAEAAPLNQTHSHVEHIAMMNLWLEVEVPTAMPWLHATAPLSSGSKPFWEAHLQIFRVSPSPPKIHFQSVLRSASPIDCSC